MKLGNEHKKAGSPCWRSCYPVTAFINLEIQNFSANPVGLALESLALSLQKLSNPQLAQV
jgi:hypothetical protein